ncbi:hypothetical protein JDV02_005504 [Purpureocillium takamizusanense]|nr:uncharacterized protein JDV02_005504 [Purpureocillium takamizusanense]UNI19312.1 hypothetical protein JDV02_005504 [Purpureocillium takamizusanense]
MDEDEEPYQWGHLECGPPPPSDEGWDPPDPLVLKYGDDPFVNAAKDPHAVKRLLADGTHVTPEGVLAAADACHTGALEVLLEAGISANIRSESAAAPDAGVPTGWTTRDVMVTWRNVIFYDEWQEWFPLRTVSQATRLPITHEAIERQIDVMRLLIKKGADPYALYREALGRCNWYPFPGDAYDEELDPPWEDRYAEEPPPQGRLYGTRSVIHSLFEEGGQVLPFFDEDFPLSLESRDPQGRTILHSACRSGLGADALVGTILGEVERNDYNRKIFVTAEDADLSLFHALRLRNADLLAVDDNGKHILHHMLEANRLWPWGSRPPVIHNAFSYVLANLPELVQKPDRHGTLPLHSAFQLWCRHQWFSNMEDEIGIVTMIQELIAAGANPLATDGRGNTALHYLAANGLAERLRSEVARRVLRQFIDLGVDVNARNASGRSAMEVFLDDDGSISEFRESRYMCRVIYKQVPVEEELDAEVFEMFDKAGVKWMETDGKGRTLLHIVAKHDIARTRGRMTFLLNKGVDALVKDSEGRTAVDVAQQYATRETASVLQAQKPELSLNREY